MAGKVTPFAFGLGEPATRREPLRTVRLGSYVACMRCYDGIPRDRRCGGSCPFTLQEELERDRQRAAAVLPETTLRRRRWWRRRRD